MRDREYWAARALQREREAYLEGSRLTAKLFREYERAAASIRESVSAFYGKYAGEHGLTYEQAVRILTRREAQAWKGLLGEYVEQLNTQTDPRVKAAMTARLDALSVNASISRLEALEGQIDLILNDLHDKGVSQLKEEFGDLFREGYYHKMYDLQSRAGWLSEFAKVDAGLVESAVNYPWSGAMFSDRLWRNKETLVFTLREAVTQGLIQGKGLAAVSKEVSGRLGQSFKAAERVVRTETNHLHNEADRAAYRAAGVEEYEFMATLDRRTCDTCGALDGKHFKLNEAQPGINFPPLHPNDRCTTVEYDPEEAADWAKAGERMPERMTYEAWAQRQELAQSADGSRGAPSPVERVGHVEPRPERVDALLGEYEKRWVGMDHEEAVVVTADGEVFHAVGGGASVDTSMLGARLRGAVDFHNHPDSRTYYSFSDMDVGYFLQMGQRESRAADSVYRYVMRRTERTVKAARDEVIAEFRKIREGPVRELAWNGEIDIDVDEYHETVIRLAEKYHFDYERVKRDAGG